MLPGMTDIYRVVPDMGGRYLAKSDGTIWVFRQLVASVRPTGHLYQSLRHPDGSHHQHAVHRLVAAAFHGPSDLPIVRHIDGDPSNNRPENLSWGSHRENSRDMVKHERSPSKLTVDQVRELILRYDEGEPLRLLAPEFGVSYNTANSHAFRRSEISRVALGL